jgi:hypothetical protein
VDRDPEERREETRRPSEASDGSPSEAANEGREGDRRRGQQVLPALETSRERIGEATSIREEPFPHEEERPRHHGLERSWWRRIFRGPHDQATQRPWWRRMFGG